MTDTAATDTEAVHTMNRRTLLKTVGATAGAAATVGYGLDGAAVQEADAIACGGICIGVGIAGAGAAAGWLLRDREVVGSDDPPTGLTGGALVTDILTTLKDRKSQIKSTFVDNKNIISNAKNAAYSKGKLAAIKSLNNGNTKSAVTTAAKDAVNAYQTVIENNLRKSWNEAVTEYRLIGEKLYDHPNESWSTYGFNTNNGVRSIDPAPNSGFFQSQYTFPDGTSKKVFQPGSSSTDTWDPFTGGTSRLSNTRALRAQPRSGGEQINGMLTMSRWRGILNPLQSDMTTVRNGLVTWVDTVYSQVQSGDLDPGQLLSPAELAQLGSSEEYQLNQAQADLLALNIPTDLERTATVSLSQTSGSSTLTGTLGVTSNVTINAGATIDPTTKSEDYYLTYDVSQAEGAWTAYNSGIDGGILTLTEQPFQNVQYEVSTADSETATFGPGAATKNTNGNYEVDLSSQLETQITTAQAISYASTVSETKNVTILLDETFTVQSFTDSSGSDVSSVDYTEPAQAETDSNYITAQEWQDREQKYKNLIDKYEKAAAGGGGGGLPGGGVLSGLPTLPGLGVVESAAVVVGGILTLNFLSD